ncbi:MAG: PA domain-containing protein [Rhodothermales bacterium]
MVQRIATTAVLLAVFLPALALAQEPDSVHVEVAGIEHPAYGAAFGPQFPAEMTIGPLPLIQVEGSNAGPWPGARPEHGCNPFVNGDEVAGNIAFISRGTCPFVQKVMNAQAVGATAVVVHNDSRGDGGQPPFVMPGECSTCMIPAAFITHESSIDIRNEMQSGPVDATILPIRITPPPVAAETGPSAGTFVLQPVYPNPLSSEATVMVSIPTAQEVYLTVYDVLGREVAVLAEGLRSAGDHVMAFDASEWAAGVYLVRLRAGNVQRTRSLTVVRR